MRFHRRTVLAATVAAVATVGFQAAQKKAEPDDPLIAGFQKTTVASVSDAVDQVIGERGFMSHDMRPYSQGRIVGRAVTALLRPSPKEKATPPLSAKHSVEMIDNARPGEVGVIVIENGLDVAGLGGLMGTDAKARGLAGVILDASVRDLAELRALKLPVYARGVVPSTTVSRYASVARGIPVDCAGVRVKPGDIIIAGEDGVVRVPQERAAEVLKRAQEIDERETKMVPHILKLKSLQKVVDMFNRI
ncbi:MAG: RraA family protein [Bryobacteraceae bacterium]